MVAQQMGPLVLVLALGCAGRNTCAAGTELMPPLCPAELPAIRSVSIIRNADKSPAEVDPNVSCAGFSIDEQVVRRYFALTKRTNENDAHHTLDYSPCQAAGEVVFENGQSGRWTLTQSRLGTLEISGQEPLILYCPDCAFEPFR
jgi:hypothetical protein